MTPHDELMALAGEWKSDAGHAASRGRDYTSAAFDRCADDLRALLDSDAFRAMFRDAAAAPFAFYVDGPSGGGLVLAGEVEKVIAAFCATSGDWPEEYTATGLYLRTTGAIDAAASGAGESDE